MVPAGPDGGEPATPLSVVTASPWAHRLTADRPQAWTDPDGSPTTSVPADLLSAPTTNRLVSHGWNAVQAATLIDHIGRTAFHASVDRDFSKAWRKDSTTGKVTPRFYTVGSPALARCQYAVLTHPQRSAVLVIDIDTPSHSPGGTIDVLHPKVQTALTSLHQQGFGPAWVGINPLNGKAQALWMIDPVYAAADQTSPNTRLLTIATAELNGLLDGDRAFAHQFCRWPLHESDDPLAYRWHYQHSQIIRLTDLTNEVRTMTSQTSSLRSTSTEQYASGRERIQAAQDARKAAQTLRDLETELPTAADIAPAAAGVIDGVRVIWVNTHRAARDETAFRYALATAHRLKAAGKPLKDTTIIDAYERAYNIAQAIGADHREPDIPPMRDRVTMARRVRGYVVQGVTNPTSSRTSSRQTSAGRKALATLGRRGGQQAAKRWVTDPDYAAAARKPLETANHRRSVGAKVTRFEIAAYFQKCFFETGEYPTTSEAMKEFNVSRDTVKRALKTAEISLPRGRRRLQY